MPEFMKGDLRLGARASSRDGVGGPSSGQLELAMEKNLLWENGKILKARLFGGTPYVREMVMKYANSNESWFDYANLSLIFVEDGDADVRITFNPDYTSSYVGTNSRSVPMKDSTVNFGWFNDETPEIEIAWAVRHEFGHVVGCIHEHQNPNGNVQWDKRKVYDAYKRIGWTKDQVDLNILDQYSTDSTNFSEYDEHSIMIYSFSNLLTTNGYCVQRNHALSETDKQWIADAYPHRGYDSSFARNEASENEAAENKVAKTKAAENEAVKNEATENEAAKNKGVMNEAVKNQVAGNKAVEKGIMENEAAENTAGKNVIREKGVGEKRKGEKGGSEKEVGEKGAGREGAGGKGAIERGETGRKRARKTLDSEQEKGENKKGRERVKNFLFQLFCCCNQSQAETERSEPSYVREKLDENMDERW